MSETRALNDYQQYCWNEAVALAGSAAESRAHKEAMAELDAEREQRNAGTIPSSTRSTSTTHSANVPRSAEGADIYPTKQGVVIASGTHPYIGKDNKKKK